MQTNTVDFQFCDELVEEFRQAVKNPVRSESSVYYVGVDLGTACVVTVVLDENRRPVAGAYEYADVVKDGMVVDYIGAVDIVRRMKAELEKSLALRNCSTPRQPFLRGRTPWTEEQ